LNTKPLKGKWWAPWDGGPLAVNTSPVGAL